MASFKFNDLQICLILTILFHIICLGSFCDDVPHCFHNKSGLCVRPEIPLSCNHQLRNEDAEYDHCYWERIEPSDCYIEAPSYISRPDELPFVMQMYYYRSWMEKRAVVNLTFPKPNWQSAKFRYQGNEDRTKVLCRKFSLVNVSFPLMDDLFWDCPIFEVPDYLNRSFDLSVITSEGTGGKYAFRVPEQSRFDPIHTKLKDWQVFFFLHVDHIGNSVNVPVTVQLVPFNHANISYNISLMKCGQDDDSCGHRETLSSILIKNPDVNATSLNDIKQITRLLQSWSYPGVYIVSVQIVSPNCSVNGCFTSFSPVFLIKASQMGMWITAAFGLITIFAFAYFITLYHRTKQNKKRLTTIRNSPPTVLLLYLPENNKCLKLIETFTSFLKEKCYVRAYAIDSDVGNENPDTWTSGHMNDAGKLLFIIPGNPNGSSVTPIVDQWHYALKYFSGHHFFTKSATKAAVILLPFSSDVPNEIGNVRRFNLVSELPSLVTWIHNGSWLDKKILWGPEIKSVSNNSSTSLTRLLDIVKEAQQETKCYKGNGKVKHDENKLLKSGNIVGEHGEEDSFICDLSGARDVEDSSDTDSISEPCVVKDFDPTIPGIDDLFDDPSGESDNSSDCSSDSDDSIYL